MAVQEAANNYVAPWYQIAWVLASTLALGLILYRPITRFNASDRYPSLVPLTPQKSIALGGTPSPIETGMYIRNFPYFDIVRGMFYLDTTLWFQFDTRLISLDRIDKFDFERVEKVEDRRGPFTRIEGDTIVARYDMVIKINAPLDYRYFPLDDHRVSFSLVHNFLSPTEGYFSSSRNNLRLSDDVSVSGWRYADKQVKTGYSIDQLSTDADKLSSYNPKVIFSIDFERLGIRYIISVIVPLFLIFFIALATFSFDPDGPNASSIVSVSIASITGAIGYRFVIENLAPATGYFMISDYIFLYVLIACCAVFMLNLIRSHAERVHKYAAIALLHVGFNATLLWALFSVS